MFTDNDVLQKCENVLNRGFDVEAYICKHIAEERLKTAKTKPTGVDLVPNSLVDEQIEDITALFVDYMQEETFEKWEILLSHIHQMLSELYHETTDADKKERFIDFVDGLHRIF